MTASSRKRETSARDSWFTAPWRRPSPHPGRRLGVCHCVCVCVCVLVCAACGRGGRCQVAKSFWGVNEQPFVMLLRTGRYCGGFSWKPWIAPLWGVPKV